MNADKTNADKIMSDPVLENYKSPKEAKTATITLNAQGTRLTLIARRLKDDSAESFVTTLELATKTSVRGMTEKFATFEAAKAAITTSAAKAEKLGWVRRAAGRGFVARPDAFSALPAAPKAAPAPKAKK